MVLTLVNWTCVSYSDNGESPAMTQGEDSEITLEGGGVLALVITIPKKYKVNK